MWLLWTCAFADDLSPKRNTLVIMLDDLGIDKDPNYVASIPDFVPTYTPALPRLDSVGDLGVRFTRMWAQPACSPARASWMTGLDPRQTGMGHNGQNFLPGLDTTAFTTIAQAFADRGYKTALFGKWHLGQQDAAGNYAIPPATSPFYDAPSPVLGGFAHFDGFLTENLGKLGPTSGPSAGSYTNWQRIVWDETTLSGTWAMESRHNTRVIGEASLDWLNDQKKDPWFAVVAFAAPHVASDAGGGGTWLPGDLDPECPMTCDDCTPRDVYRVLAQCADEQIGLLLDGLKELEDTLVIITSDNGTPNRAIEAPIQPYQVKQLVYELSLRVPFYVADGETLSKGREKSGAVVVGVPRVVDAPVRFVDLFPTLFAQAFGELPPAHPSGAAYAGEDISACLTDASDPLCGLTPTFKYAERWQNLDGSGGRGRAAVLRGDDKMMAMFPQPVPPLNALPPDCLTLTYFDVSSDLLERAPATDWTEDRKAVLRDHFASLHTGSGDWADGVPFCP